MYVKDKVEDNRMLKILTLFGEVTFYSLPSFLFILGYYKPLTQGGREYEWSGLKFNMNSSLKMVYAILSFKAFII